MKESFDVIVVGAGMGGLVLAESLSRKGYRTAILERQPHFTPIPRGELLQPNGLKIFDQLGLLEEIKTAGSRSNHLFHFYRIGGPRLCTIDYRMLPPPYQYALITLPEILMRVLLKRISENKHVQILWGTEFRAFLRGRSRVTGVQASRGREDLRLLAPVVIGADGVYSRVRKEMGIRYHLKAYGHGYLTMFSKRPAGFGEEGRYYMGRKTILGIFPVSDTRLYLFYLTPDHLQASLRSRPEELGALKKAITAIDPGVEEVFEDITTWEQVGYMPCRRVKASRWVGDGVALMGDAAHAMNPHVSQGRNQALEDAMVLTDVITNCFQRGDFSQNSLFVYEATRRRLVERLQRLADEEVFFWNAGDPIRTWLRDRVFCVLDRNSRLRYKTLAQVAGVNMQPFTLLDYLKAAGFLPDTRADDWP
ncbi:MAG: FAD-dependent monooxygenase [Nitrospira sp.]|nr:FAD-dependent monooxygenase [Nitrospira sp.]